VILLVKINTVIFSFQTISATSLKVPLYQQHLSYVLVGIWSVWQTFAAAHVHTE